MVRDAATRLTEYVRGECGEALRTVVLQFDDEWECIYLREDLQAEYDQETFDQAVTAFPPDRLDGPDVAGLPLGGRQAIVFSHEHAFVLQFQYEDAAILVSVRAEAGRDLLAFIERCREVVQQE